jgi:shikimate dehydrogenase
MTQLISGHTKLIAHLGVPTESFRAPMIYNPYFEANGIDAVVMPMGCESEDYEKFLPLVARLRNFIGALVTMPHKVTSVALLDEVSTAVKVCGACNAIRRDESGRLIGDMFDGEGFTRGVLSKGREIKGASALVVGSGGVGSAIAAALAKAGAARLGLYDVNSASTLQLADRLRQHYPQIEVSTGSNDPAGWDIVTNATPLGMNAGDAMPMDVSRIAAESFVGEVVMKQAETAFLAAAKAQGCVTQIGTDMLYEQIPAYLEFFGLPSTTPDELRRVARIRY